MPLADRRADRRYPIQAVIQFNHDGQVYGGSCYDLGKGGLSFLAGVAIPVGQSLTITLLLTLGQNRARLTVKGIVRWNILVEPGTFRYGVAFSGLNSAQQKVLLEFLVGPTEAPLAKTRPLQPL